MFFDYTCAHSYRMSSVLRRVAPSRGLEIRWRTLSLKEFKRPATEPSLFAGDGVHGFSLLALALSHAVRPHDHAGFHDRLFDLIHGDHRALTREDLLAIAGGAGLDAAAFQADEARWLAEVEAEHREGVERWHAHGTPTLVFETGPAVYVRLVRPPSDDADAARIWASIEQLALHAPEVLELKRST